MASSNTAAVSLAILKINSDTGRDYIDNFVPFVVECIRLASHQEIALADLQQDISDRFGMDIPQGTLNTILRRCVKRDYVTRSKQVYFRNNDAVASVNLSQKRDAALRELGALVDKFQAFVKERFSRDVTEEGATLMLLGFLDESSGLVLSSLLDRGLALEPERERRKDDYLVSSFIAELIQRDPEGFSFMETMVKGSMLACALLFPELSSVDRKFDSLRVYLDTRFVLQALGLEGVHRQKPRIELLDLLYAQNAQLFVFRDTVDEITRVLVAAVSVLRVGAGGVARGETIQELQRMRFTASDVELVLAELDRSLRGLRVRVVQRPRYTTELSIDEPGLGATLKATMKHLRPEALEHDVVVLSAIHRLRGGEFFPNIENTKAIFVTTHRQLFRGCRDFCDSEYRNRGIGYCILDDVLTTIVWLKTPQRAPDLPRQRIIADVFAALNPPNPLWQRYETEIRRLQASEKLSAEQYDLLRYSVASRNALMDITLGDVGAFAEGTVDEVLARAEAAARADVEREAERIESEREVAEQRARAAEERIEEQAEAFDARDRERRIRIRSRSVVAGHALAVVAKWLLLLVVVAVTFLFLYLAAFPGGWLVVVLLALGIPVGILTVANLTVGVTLDGLAHRLEIAIADALEGLVSRVSS